MDHRDLTNPDEKFNLPANAKLLKLTIGGHARRNARRDQPDFSRRPQSPRCLGI